MHLDIHPHIGTTKSNIQAVDKHLNRMGLLFCATVKEVNNKYLNYVESYESKRKEEEKIIIIKMVHQGMNVSIFSFILGTNYCS